MSNKKSKLNGLFDAAVSAGIISDDTRTLITGSLGNVVIAGAAGKDLEDIEATDVTLITVLLDESSSISGAGLDSAVRDGYNLLLDAFACSRERDSILMALWTFNHNRVVLHSYMPVVDAASLTTKNYRPSGTTKLYDTWCEALAANVAYAQQLRDGGTPCRSVVVVITDGEDVGSRRRAADCARLSSELLASEQFVLAFVGVGNEANFREVARRMGVPDGSILVQSSASPSALRQMFQMVSQSAIRVSQSLIQPGPNAGFFN